MRLASPRPRGFSCRLELPALALPLLLAALWAPGCGGSGGGGGAPPPTVPPTGVTFTADGSGGANSIRLASQGSNGTAFNVDLLATEVADLYGIAFDLAFPDNLIRFDAAVEGTMMERSGTFETSLQVVEVEPGLLVVGLSRLGDVKGADGGGLLLTLEFTAVGSGSGDLAFDETQGFDSDGNEQVGLAWEGGSIVVTL